TLAYCLRPRLISLLCLRHPLSSLSFPYTTLFRSDSNGHDELPGCLGTGRGTCRPAMTISVISSAAVISLTGSSGYRLLQDGLPGDRKSTRLNSSHQIISYAVVCFKKNTNDDQ